jgi:hypothetical protein
MRFSSLLALTIAAGSALTAFGDFSYAFVFGEPTEDIAKNGDATFADGAYRLTTGSDQAGSIFHTTKQQVANGFHTIFSFRIEPSSIMGDGFAFVIQNDAAMSAALGAGGSDLGYAGIASSLAIEFDTFSFSDPNDPGSEPAAMHVAVHTRGNSPNESGAHATLAIAPWNPDFNRLFNDVNVAITYQPADPDDPASLGNLQVWVEEVQLINLDIDLTNIIAPGIEGDSIPDANGEMFMGFTTSTGLADSVHVIRDWTVRADTGRDCVSPQWHLASWGSGSDGVTVSASFEVDVSGTRPLAFSWFKDETLIDPSADPTRITGSESPRLNIFPASVPADFGFYRLEATNDCGSLSMDNFMRFGIENECNDIDFNNDGLFPDDTDLITFLAVLAGGACPSSICDPIDFNNDSLFPDDSDLVAFLRVLAGGPCVE